MKALGEMLTDSSLFLELLNGGAITPEVVWLTLLTVYLVKESRRRHLAAFDWLKLPASMNLIIAIWISDFGVSMRSTTIWTWRRMGAGDFTPVQHSLLAIGASLIVMGTLCKIRAITAPDHGDVPWFVAAVLTAAVVVLMLVLR